MNEPVIVDSLSGNQLHSLLISSESNASHSLMVHFHGNAGNITWTGQRYSWLKEHGYDLLIFDYSGYGQSTGSASPEFMWLDAVTILNYVLELKQLNPGRWKHIVLAGTSLGGNVLLNALSDYEKQEAFDAVFIDSSFLSYKELAASIVESKPGGFLAVPFTKFIMSDDFAPVKDLPIYLKQPLIVAHCDSDALIPSIMGREIYDELHAPAKRWLLLSNCPHAQGFHTRYPDNQLQLVNTLKESLKLSY